MSCTDRKKAAAAKKAFKAKSKGKHPAAMKQRYPRRNIATKHYRELELSGDEGEYFFVCISFTKIWFLLSLFSEFHITSESL